MAQNYALRVNGAARNVSVEPDTPLLYILRNDLDRDLPFTPQRVKAALAATSSRAA